jgi:hypothetical protein
MSNFQLFKKNPTGGETTSTLVEASGSGYGLKFDGAAGNIDIASPPDLGTSFSFEFIIQADSIAASGYNYIADFGNGGGRFSVLSYNGSLAAWDTGARTFGATFLDDLKVHHVFVTVDGTSAIAYDNGNLVGTATLGASSNIDSCTDAAIGAKYDGSFGYFDGTIFRARFWNKALSSAEIKECYENATVKLAEQGAGEEKIKGVGTNFATACANVGAFNSAYNGSTAGNMYSSGPTAPTIVVASNAATITNTSTDSGNGSGLRFDLSAVTGKTYRLNINVTAITGNWHVKASNSGWVTLATIDSTGAKSIVLPAWAYSDASLYLVGGAQNDAITITAGTILNSLAQIGNVADYDCAFSNPSVSLTIQDRANAADGTSSANGVKQLTPIDGVNTNKLNIGGTTPRLGVGLAAGTAPVRHIQVNDATEPDILLTRTSGATSGALGNLYFGNQDVDQYLCHIGAVQDGATDAGKLEFSTEATGGARATRMTIDSSGNVNIGDGTIPANTKLMVQGYVAGANVQTADTNKYFYITGVPYTTTEENSSIIGNDNFDGVNRVTIGGGSGNFNAATVIKFYTAANSTTPTGTERMQIDADGLVTCSNGIAVTTGGVKFPATQSASADANTLDDYEEGEWQPTVTCSTSGSYTLHASYDTCVYTKIGRLVQVQGKLYITGESSPSGDIRISLPITSLGGLSDDSEYVVGSANLNSHGGTLDNVVANVGAAYAYMWLTSTAEDGTAATITHADVDTSWWLTFNFSYLA